jgi:phage gp36-like protein
MPYASTTQIQIAAGGAVKYVEIFDHDNDGVADATLIAQFQLQVDSWIDSYAGKRYAVPMVAPTQNLVEVAAEEIVYRAKGNMVSELEQKQHEERIAWLEGVAKGLVVPCDPPPAKASTVRSAWVSNDTNDISREKLKGAW